MSVIGRSSAAGIGKETTWGTGVAADEKLPFISEELSRVITQVENQYLDGETAIPGISNTNQEATASVTCEGVYDVIAGDVMGIDALIYGALGSGVYSSSYSIYKPADDLDLSWTFGVLKDTTAHEIHGAKISSLEISCAAGGTLQVTANFVGEEILLTGESGIVNTSATLGSGLAPTTFPDAIRFDQMTFRIDTLGAALSSADEACISEFTLTIENSLTAPSFSSTCSGHSDATLTLEPVREGRRRITLSVTYPRFTDFTDFTWLVNGTEVQADIKFNASSTKNFDILLPRLRVTNAEASVSGPGMVPKTIEFLALNNNSTYNTDMTDAAGAAIAYEMVIQTENLRTAIAS